MFSINWWVRDCVVREKSGEGVWGCRGRRAQGKQGLSGTTVRGIWGDLEDRMIRHPGIRWHRAQIVSTIWDRGCTRDFPSPLYPLPPPPAIYILEMFVCSRKEMSGSGYSYSRRQGKACAENSQLNTVHTFIQHFKSTTTGKWDRNSEVKSLVLFSYIVDSWLWIIFVSYLFIFIFWQLGMAPPITSLCALCIHPHHPLSFSSKQTDDLQNEGIKANW